MWTLGDFEMDESKWRRGDFIGGRLGCRMRSIGDFEIDHIIRSIVDSTSGKLIFRRLSLGDFETDQDTESMIFLFLFILQKSIRKN
jgi:hypothetical protein